MTGVQTCALPISYLSFYTSNNFRYNDADGTAGTGGLITNAVYRDPSSWYHIVLAIDSTQATAANRLALYVNGVQVTSFSSTDYPTQNRNMSIFASGTQYIGYSTPGNNFSDGFMSEVFYIDGQQLTASSFGQTDSATGVWVPKKYTGTYGNNGFYLPFTDTSSTDRKSTRLNSSHIPLSRMPSSA